MMKVHNSKVTKITTRYVEYCKLRQLATETGVPFEELQAQSILDKETEDKKKKKTVKKGASKKKKALGNFGVK